MAARGKTSWGVALLLGIGVVVGAMPALANEALHLAFVDESRLVVLYLKADLGRESRARGGGVVTQLALQTPAGIFGHTETLKGSALHQPELPLPHTGQTVVMEQLTDGALLFSAGKVGPWQPQGDEKAFAGRRPKGGGLPVANAEALRLWVDQIPEAHGQAKGPVKTRGTLFGRDRFFDGDVLVWWAPQERATARLVVLDTDSMWQSPIQRQKVTIASASPAPGAQKKGRTSGGAAKGSVDENTRHAEVHGLDAVRACGGSRPATWIVSEGVFGGYRFFAKGETECSGHHPVAFARGKKVTPMGDQAALAIWIGPGRAR
jgi:hypothetical protein